MREKKFKILGNILFTVFMIIMSFLIFITAQSKLTRREPSLLDRRIYIVNSGSMSPTIKVDSMIIVHESKPNEILKGDIITYYGHNKESRVTHRVMEVQNNGGSFITRGDANATDDPMPLDGEKLIGKVEFTIPFIGNIFRFLSTRIGISLFLTIAIVWMVLPKILQKNNKQKSSKFKCNGGDMYEEYF